MFGLKSAAPAISRLTGSSPPSSPAPSIRPVCSPFPTHYHRRTLLFSQALDELGDAKRATAMQDERIEVLRCGHHYIEKNT